MFLGPFSSRRAPTSRKSSVAKSRNPKRRRILTAECLEKRAMLSVSPNFGILTLDTSSAGTLYHSGAGSIIVNNGDIGIDSISSSGAQNTGSGNVSANHIYVHGNLSASGSGKFLGSVATASAQFADPLASVPQPSTPGTTFNITNIANQNITLSPGTYLGHIQISGTSNVTLLPGVYYLASGLSMTSGTLTGSGVTIFNASNSITIGGASSVTLSAPTSGAYQGIVLFQSRSDIRPVTISGSATATLTGEVYLPDGQFQVTSSGNTQIKGNGGSIPGVLIAKDIAVSGAGSLTVNANAGGLTGNLSTTKTDNLGGSSITSTDGLATAGSSIVYTITVANAGPNAAFGATVSDTLPAAFTSDTYTVATTGGAADVTHTSGSGAIADSVNLPSGSTITYTVTANISASATGLITNSATVTAPSGFADTNLSNNTASDTDSLYKADLAVTNTDGTTTAVPGAQTTYTIVVSNNGPTAVTGATVKDLLAANADITSDTFTVAATGGATDSINAASGSGSINDAVNMPVGSTITYTVTANIGAAVTGSLVNTATVTPPAIFGDPVPANNSATDTDTLTPHVDLLVTNTDNDSGAVIPGTQVTYTIVVKNTGPSAAVGVAIADALPEGITSDSYTATGTTGASGFTASGSGNINDASVNLAVGSCITYSVVANVSAAATGTLSNTAAAKAGTGQTNTNPNQVSGTTAATDADTLAPHVDLVVTTTDNDSGTVVPGEAVTYTVTVHNSGPSNAVGVAIADALPAGITSDTYTAVGTTGASGFTASGSGNMSDASASLAAGSSITYTVVANVSAAAIGTLSNTATAKAGTGESNTNPSQVSGTTSATDTDTLTPQVDLVVTKTDNDSGTVVPGTQLTYTVTVQNAGPSNAVAVAMADTLPAGITSDTYTAVGSSGASSFTASGSGNISDGSVNLAAGSSITYTVLANIGAANTGSLSNTATATVGAGETNTNPNEVSGVTSAIDTDAQTPQVDLLVTAADNLSGHVVPGQPVTYTITVQNTGPSNAVGVAIADALPTGITSDTYTAVGTSGASGFTASGSGNISDASVNLAVGSKITYTVTANISAAATGTLGDTATATAGTGETNTNPNQVSGTTSATDSHALTPTVSLVVVKSDSGGGDTIDGAEGYVVPGNTVTYTITVQSAGPSNAVGVTIADAFPASITSDTYTAVGTAGASGFTASGSGNIDDTAVNLAAGSGITYTVVASVSPAATGLLSNAATAKVGAGETNTYYTEIGGTTSAIDVDTLTPKVDLVVTNTDNAGGHVVPGTPVTYTITVQNTGPSNAAGVTVADTLPAGITSDTYTATGTTGASGFTASGSGNISDASVNLAAGSSITYTVTAQLSTTAAGSLVNTAAAKAGAGETNTNPGQSGGTTSATDTDPISPQVDLVVTKLDSGFGTAVPGQQVVYVISVTNAGPNNATGVAIADLMPAGIASDTYTANGTPGTFGFTASGSGSIDDLSVSLASGSSVTYLVMANISSAATGSLTDTATATVGTGETNTFPGESDGTTTATNSDTLTPQVQLLVTGSDSGGGVFGGFTGSVLPGGTVTYTFTVQNNGPSDAVGAAIADALPDYITSNTYTAVGAAGASGFTASGNGNIDDTSVNLVSGSSITYTVVATIDAGATATLNNTVTATVGAGETNTEFNQVAGTTTETDSDNIAPQVDLVVTNADDRGGTSAGGGKTGSAVPGSAVTYTITVENTGPSNATGVAIDDVLPAGITSDTYTAVGTGGASGFTASGSGNIADGAINLASGSSITYTIVANVDPSATGTLSNTATAAANLGETNTNPNQSGGISSATDVDTLTPQVDLVVTNTDNDSGNVVPGQCVTYTITVQNTGPSNAVGVAILDTMPAGIIGDTYAAIGTTGASSFTVSGSGNISDASTSLAAGSSITYTVVANVCAAATGTLSNTAAAAAGAGEANTNAGQSGGTTSTTDTVALTPQVDLAVTNTDNDGGIVVPGEAVIYTITVQNTGPSYAVGVAIGDALPAGITSDTYTAIGTGGASGFTASSSGNISDASVNLAAGSSITYTVVANVCAASTGTLSNTATATAGTGETNTNAGQSGGTTSATDTASLTPQVDLTVTNTDDDGGTVVPGEAVTYTITIQNTGPSNAVGATVADALPAGVTSDTYTTVGATGASGFTASGSGNIDDTSVSLAAGSSITYTVVANVSAAATGTLSNTAAAAVSAGETNTNVGKSGGTTSTTDNASLTPQVDLVVTSTDNDSGNVVPGEAVTYTITVENAGPSNASGVAVADTLPAGITSDTYTAAGTTGASGFTASGSGNISDASTTLAAGSSVTYTVVASVGAVATGTLNNTATATVGTGETNTNAGESGGTTSATDSAALTPQVDLVVTTSDNDGGTVVPGQTVKYTVTMQNTGPSAAVGLTLADALPAGVSSDTYTAAGTTGAAGFTASGSGNIDDTSVNLAADSSVTYTVTANVSAAATGTLSNTAAATAGAGETNTNAGESGGTTSATDIDSLTPQVDLVVTKTENGGANLVPGETVTYTITITDAGPSNAVGATVADALPAGISSDTYTASGTAGTSGFTASGSGNIDDTSVNLAAGASVTYAVVANIGAAATGTLTNTATATVGTGETNLYPNQVAGTTSSTDSESLTPQVDLVVVKTDDGGGSSAGGGTTGVTVQGGTVTYTITIQNTGPTNAVGVAIADLLPAAIVSDTFTAVGTSGTSGFTTSGSGNINDTSVNLAAGSTVTYTVTANISFSAFGPMSNTATATAGTGQTNTNPNQVGGITSATDSDFIENDS